MSSDKDSRIIIAAILVFGIFSAVLIMALVPEGSKNTGLERSLENKEIVLLHCVIAVFLAFSLFFSNLFATVSSLILGATAIALSVNSLFFSEILVTTFSLSAGGSMSVAMMIRKLFGHFSD